MAQGNDGYLLTLMEKVSKLDYLSDVTLVAGIDREKFPVHRNIMVAASPYFEALLGPNYKEANESEVTLSDIDGNTLKAVIDFCYTGRIAITNENVGHIMAAASSKELVPLEKLCSKFWSENLDSNCCLNVLSEAEKYHLTELSETSMRYICENLMDIPIREMVKIDQKMLGAILEQNEITAAESVIFDRFMKWIQHDELNRSAHVASLAKSIRLEHLPIELLEKTVEPFYEKHGCFKLVVDEYRWYRKRPHEPRESEKLSLNRFMPREKKLCAAIVADGIDEIEIHEFNEETKCWSRLESFPFHGEKLDCFYVGGKLIVFDTPMDETDNLKNRMRSYDLKSGNTVHLPHAQKIEGPLISFGRYIYHFKENSAASVDGVGLGLCERFDTENNYWETRAQLPFVPVGISATRVNGFIYVSIDDFHYSNFWCYDPERDVWTKKADITAIDGMSDTLEDLILFSVKGRIYLCDGHIGVKAYDHADDSWTEVKTQAPNWKAGLKMLISIYFEGNHYGYLTTEDGDEHFGNIKVGAYAHFIEQPQEKSFNSAQICSLFIH